MEYRLRRYDGKYRWVLDSGIPLCEPAGEFAGYIGSCIDITEHKRAEEKQGALIAELDHRVKNMLATVAAIPRAGPRPQRMRFFTGVRNGVEPANWTNGRFAADRQPFLLSTEYPDQRRGDYFQLSPARSAKAVVAPDYRP